MTWVLIAVAAIVVIAVLYWIAKRNSLIAARNRVDESWSGIDVQLKRRHDLVPNLVETVKGYAAHESQVFEKTSKARAEAMSAHGVGDTAQAEQKLTGALTDLRAVAENYPDLRATENFQQLQAQLSETEDQIQITRRVYNDTVQTYNTFIQIFPPSLIANAFNFEPRQFFDAPSEDEAAPEVSFAKGEAKGEGAAPTAASKK